MRGKAKLSPGPALHTSCRQCSHSFVPGECVKHDLYYFCIKNYLGCHEFPTEAAGAFGPNALKKTIKPSLLKECKSLYSHEYLCGGENRFYRLCLEKHVSTVTRDVSETQRLHSESREQWRPAPHVPSLSHKQTKSGCVCVCVFLLNDPEKGHCHFP